MKKLILIMLVGMCLISLVNADVIESFKEGVPNALGGDGILLTYGWNSVSQTFTLDDKTNIEKLKLIVSKSGFPGEVKVSIRNAENGIPIGIDLKKNLFNSDDLNEYENNEIELNMKVTLEKGQYAIVFEPVNLATGYDDVFIIPTVSNQYDRGSLSYKKNLDSWKIMDRDMHFEIIGNIKEKFNLLLLIPIGIIAIFIIGIIILLIRKFK